MNFQNQADEYIHSEAFNKYELPDIAKISFPDADSISKMQAFLQTVKNPYLFRVGDIGFHVVFSANPGILCKIKFAGSCRILFDLSGLCTYNRLV